MQNPSTISPTIAIVVFPLFFLTIWCGVCFVLSRVSGWNLLSTRFRTDSPFSGETWVWQSARMRWFCNYNHCLTFGSDRSGLYMAIMFIFRLGSPPLLIPWPEVTIGRRRTVLFFPFVELRIGREEGVPLLLSARLAESLRSAAGPSWPIEPVC